MSICFKKISFRKPEKAQFRLVHIYRGNPRTHKNFRVYIIFPPASRPFLPSREALLGLIGQFPEIRFRSLFQFPSRDFFEVRCRAKNMFNSRELSFREERDSFLAEVTAMSQGIRDISNYVTEACTSFVESTDYQGVSWNGRFMTPCIPGLSGSGLSMPSDKDLQCKFKELDRLCAFLPPFTFPAA
jgi:hypothetical protein